MKPTMKIDVYDDQMRREEMYPYYRGKEIQIISTVWACIRLFTRASVGLVLNTIVAQM